MTPRQQRFCDEYLIDCNATQAVIRAGYSEKTARQIGSELLAKPDIRAYIEEQLERIHNERTADVQEVMEYLTSVMRGQSTASVLASDGLNGQKIVEKPPDEKERLKAAELIGKRHGMFTDKLGVEGAAPVMVVDDV